jgi:hypothetical protein
MEFCGNFLSKWNFSGILFGGLLARIAEYLLNGSPREVKLQKAGEGQTLMGNFAHKCVLNWKGGKKTVPFNLTTNTPIFFMAPSSCAYCTFALTFKVLEAPYFCRETVLQFPGCRYTDDKPALVPEDFVAEENINFHIDMSINEGVKADDKAVKTSNLP